MPRINKVVSLSAAQTLFPMKQIFVSSRSHKIAARVKYLLSLERNPKRDSGVDAVKGVLLTEISRA